MTATTDPSPVTDAGSGAEPSPLLSAFQDYVAKVRAGDVGSLPAVLGFVVLVVFFALKTDQFFSLLNGANLLQQGAGVIFVAMGLVFVLLLGEIDLSAGFAAGTAAAAMGVLMTQHSVAWPLAVLGCLLTGAVIGVVIGLLVARLNIPSFVVTLSFFLGLQGAMLAIIGEGGTIPIRDSTILAVMNDNVPVLWSWVLFVGSMLIFVGLGLNHRRVRRAANLPAEPIILFAVKSGGLAIVLGVATYLLNLERSVNPTLNSLKGVPIIVPIAAVFVVALTFVLHRTTFGRHVYAVGGNAEAARRAGISVPGIRVACFVICSTMAAFAGILFASRDNSVSPTTGG
ncbi:MAG TPA: ABC transporter permease, partial [Kineosporiaceae bacterium]|nr:ABC transporter permease [Kineosporiaceae bacterium]